MKEECSVAGLRTNAHAGLLRVFNLLMSSPRSLFSCVSTEKDDLGGLWVCPWESQHGP